MITKREDVPEQDFNCSLKVYLKTGTRSSGKSFLEVLARLLVVANNSLLSLRS